jgi:hypothetical protein
MPGDAGVLVVTRVRSTPIIAHETAGAAGIRHSPRPSLGGRFLARLGCSAPRGREVISEIGSAVIASAAKQSILSCFLPTTRGIASRSLSSGAHSRDPLARNDGSIVAYKCALHPQPSSPAKAGDPVVRGVSDGIERPQRTGCPACAGHDGLCEERPPHLKASAVSKGEKSRTRRAGVEAPSAGSSIRSAHLTIFWHCGCRRFSFRKAPERPFGNEPSMVLAEDARPKGSGNADSQPNAWSSGWSGQRRSCPRDSGCVLAHPASWRASASYRPLRAVWADCAWALRGCARSPDPLSARSSAHLKEFSQ